MRSTAKEFCEFASTLQELLALIRGEGIRGGRGLGEGDDWMSHGLSRGGEEGVELRCSLYGTCSYG